MVAIANLAANAARGQTVDLLIPGMVLVADQIEEQCKSVRLPSPRHVWVLASRTRAEGFRAGQGVGLSSIPLNPKPSLNKDPKT